jgi:hypothetical protein
MRTLRLALLSFCITLAASAVALADEGMWPLYSVDQLPLDYLRSRGLKLQPQQIYNTSGSGLADAVVQVGGATGSFVSPDGLILTNHHVAFRAVQEQSTVEHNYLQNGFYASSRQDELEAIGYRIYVTLSVEDVTPKILNGVKDGLSALQRYQTIDKNTKKLIRDTEKGRPVKAKVAAMFGGRQYMLYTTLELRDIRMVYVPPDAIGNYGGDIDNWMWPRHTGDFSFLRAYVAPDGAPADYSPSNVPYRPKVFLPISTSGIREGDLVMTIGFPGSTSRHISSYELADKIDLSYPASIKTNEDLIAIMDGAGKHDKVIGLRLESDLAGLNNSLKKSYATVEGFRKGHLLEHKRETERQLVEFLANDPQLQARFGRVLPTLDSLYEAHRKIQIHDFLLERMTRYCDYLQLATTIYRWACEREKPDLERDRGYQDRDTLIAKERLENAQINLVPEVDKKLMVYFLEWARKLPSDQRIAPLADLQDETSADKVPDEQLVERWYANTRVGNPADRLAMFAMTRKQLDKLDDAFISLARELQPERDDLRQREKEFSGAESRLTPLLIQALAEWKPSVMYPDANGSMRLSYGEVKSYVPRDAISYFYQTTLNGVMDKENGKDPFIVPDSLAEAFVGRDYGPWVDPAVNDIPVNFLTTNDITGGNSGSPMINGEGNLVGVAFDGNWEGVASDYLFNPSVTRTIGVDIRYVMFIIDRVYHLESLVEELSLKPTGRTFQLGR